MRDLIKYLFCITLYLPIFPVFSQTEIIVNGLQIPWAITDIGKQRFLITERAGRIILVELQNKTKKVVLRLPQVIAKSESGLLGIDTDKNFANNGFLYIAFTHYDKKKNLVNALAKLYWDESTSTLHFHKILLDNVEGARWHNGGRVKVGQDGHIYWSTGDATNPDLAQDLTSLNGKILRISTDGTIPTDNPFNNYIYSYGHRNVQGLAWHPTNNQLYATEHGPSGIPKLNCCQDEINQIHKGANYGWPIITGSQSKTNLQTPIIHSGNDTWAPSGMTIPTTGKWQHNIIFTGLRGQSIYQATITQLKAYFTNQFGRIRDIIEAKDKQLYFITNNQSEDEGYDKLVKIITVP
ncbi:MAG: PQQ-dependent sugar dehydrogenase [Methylacidiphilales bacterium]|nr:PQQ-dependent sugar dehydrogenase [Candidatus Methylacidiphilales bacterium]